MFRPWRGVNSSLASLPRRISRLGELSGAKRWLLVAVIVVLIALLCYSIYFLSPYLEGLEQYGYIGAFMVAFISSSSVLFPIPGIAVILAMATSPAFSWALVALAAAIGGGLGEFTAYLAGYGGAVVISPEQSKWYKRAEDWMKRYGGVTIFVFAFTWLPFDIVGIAAGALKFPFWKFLLATLAGRLPRTFIECYLAYLGWEILSGLAWWVWAIIGIYIAVIIGGIVVWRRRRA